MKTICVFQNAGASKTLVNDNGDTALDVAQEENEAVVVELLTTGTAAYLFSSSLYFGFGLLVS